MRSPFGSMQVIIVEEGTMIELDEERKVVTDEQCVFKGDKIYVTQLVYDHLKEIVPERQ